ncbi:MAG: hypothetical protein WA828_11525 [Coleofasciculaceae cyanobacterium]
MVPQTTRSKIIQQFKAAGCTASLPQSSQIAAGRSQQSTRCVRWSTFSQSLGINRRGGPYRTFNELPNGFKQGCIFFQDNNAIDVAYVLKDGIQPSVTLTDGQFSLGGAPSFSNEQSKQFDDLTARGQALMITWLTPTNGSLPYLRSIPKDRTFVRDDGMVCYGTVCLKSSAVSNQQLSQILEAGQIATGRSPSSGQQTTTARSQDSNQCPVGQLPVTIKTPDGQSPSYAGAARAGRNKNGKRDNGSKIEAGTRCILFVEIQKPSNPKQTWVITHGWDDSSSGSLNSLAREVAKQNPGDRVLMLDWSEASINSGDDAANPLGISEKLSRGNYYAATWIRPVAEVAVNELKNKYGISDAEANKNLNLIGHSLGSIMSSEIGYIYSKSQRNVEGNKKGVNLMIALDPPSEFNVGLSNPIVGLGGYDVDGRTPAYKDVRKPSVRVPILNVPILNIEVLPPLTLTSPFETRTLVPNNVDRPQRFDKISRFSRAFVGNTSFAGNQVLAATANESFQMDFGERSDTPLSLGTEHMLVVEAFTKRISGAGLIPGFLGLKDRQIHTDIKQNAYPYLININPLNPTKPKYEYGHEGVINISSSNEFKAFHLESSKLGKVVFSNIDSATEDTNYINLDLSIRGDVSRVAGGSLYPNVFKIFPSISPINYTPLIR